MARHAHPLQKLETKRVSLPGKHEGYIDIHICMRMACLPEKKVELLHCLGLRLTCEPNKQQLIQQVVKTFRAEIAAH